MTTPARDKIKQLLEAALSSLDSARKWGHGSAGSDARRAGDWALRASKEVREALAALDAMTVEGEVVRKVEHIINKVLDWFGDEIFEDEDRGDRGSQEECAEHHSMRLSEALILLSAQSPAPENVTIKEVVENMRQKGIRGDFSMPVSLATLHYLYPNGLRVVKEKP